MAKIAPLGRYRALDANAAPLAGGLLYTYEAGTNTPKATYTDKNGGTANTNPVVMDSEGYADVWLDTGGYKFVLKNADEVTQWTVDNVDGGVDGGFGSTVISKSSSFALTTLEQGNVIVCTSALTISLLSAVVAGNGYSAIIINTSSGNVTIEPDGVETINGGSSLIIARGNSAVLSTDGTAWFTYGSNVAFSDDSFRVFDAADSTKQISLDVGGVITGTTATFTLTNNTLTIPSIGSAEGKLILKERLEQGGNTATITPTSPMAADRTYTLPDETGTFALTRTPTMAVLTSGTSWNVPATITRVKYRMVGGGGAGGASNTTNGPGSGGGAGGYCEGYITVTAGGTLAYTIGAGGVGVNNANGGNGGSTTLNGTITASGGAGGVLGASASVVYLGGLGGAATGGDINIAGQDGNNGLVPSGTVMAENGSGASSPLGFGGILRNPYSGTVSGSAGKGYGAGGSAGFGSGTNAGGNGAAGVIILEYDL